MAAEIFYIDQARLKREQQNFSRTLDRLKKAVLLWERTTSFKIKDIGQFQTIAQDPEKVFLDLVRAEQSDAEEKLKQIFGGRANTEKLLEEIYLPQGWDKVKAAMADIAKVKWMYFTIHEGTVDMSQEWHDLMLGKCYFVIENDLQRKRLKYCQELIKQLADSKKLLIAEIKEKGKSEESFWKHFTTLDFIAALPTGVRVVDTNKYDRGEAIRQLEPDPYFVTMGYAVQVRGLEVHKAVNNPSPQDYRLAWVRMGDGSDQKVLFLEGAEVPTDTMRVTKSLLTPHIYHVVNGRIINTGRVGKRYPDHGLYVQQ